ncbi:MAG TPA: hypothetical protein VFO79_10645, partial [Xanthomonadales bacterium]|nr:hypothetical protein [Xanthomonadales bacterium]
TVAVAAFAAPAAAQAPAPLASQETNLAGVTAEVTEFKRRGNTLTVKVRMSNAGSEDVTVDLEYDKTYVLDAAGGRKYEVLRDDAKNYIAAIGPSYSNRYWNTLKPGQPLLVWMKFPAPPPEVKTATFQLDDTPPFDDLPIQD